MTPSSTLLSPTSSPCCAIPISFIISSRSLVRSRRSDDDNTDCKVELRFRRCQPVLLLERLKDETPFNDAGDPDAFMVGEGPLPRKLL